MSEHYVLISLEAYEFIPSTYLYSVVGPFEDFFKADDWRKDFLQHFSDERVYTHVTSLELSPVVEPAEKAKGLAKKLDEFFSPSEP